MLFNLNGIGSLETGDDSLEICTVFYSHLILSRGIWSSPMGSIALLTVRASWVHVPLSKSCFPYSVHVHGSYLITVNHACMWKSILTWTLRKCYMSSQACPGIPGRTDLPRATLDTLATIEFSTTPTTTTINRTTTTIIIITIINSKGRLRWRGEGVQSKNSILCQYLFRERCRSTSANIRPIIYSPLHGSMAFSLVVSLLFNL